MGTQMICLSLRALAKAGLPSIGFVRITLHWGGLIFVNKISLYLKNNKIFVSNTGFTLGSNFPLPLPIGAPVAA
jgi:hypothetical protein